jgi:hypothetical protein
VLLAQGLGRKAELQCRKTSQGVLTLIRIEGIEGIEVSEQTGFGPGIRERSRDRAQQLSPEDRETFRARFKDMRERLSEDPELREELRESSREDPDAFRQRIRQMMPELHQRPERRRPQRDEDPGGMSNHRGSRMMGRMGPGQEMGPRGREGRRRFSPEDEELQKLERQTHELAEQCHRADGQEKDELGEKLRETLSQVFEKKDQAQSQEVERLEKQLDKLRSRLENREKNREAIINQRFDKLTGQQDDELAW